MNKNTKTALYAVGLLASAWYFTKWHIEIKNGKIKVSKGFKNAAITVARPYQYLAQNGIIILEPYEGENELNDGSLVAGIEGKNIITDRILFDITTGKIIKHLPDHSYTT